MATAMNVQQPAKGVDFLRVENLILHFRTQAGPIQAVDGVSLVQVKGRSLVVIGESGSGKSSLAKAILRLLPRNVHAYRGKVYMDDVDTMALSEEQFRRRVRWVKAAMVPQAAQNALNPVIRVQDQVAEPLYTHGKVKSKDEKAALDQVRKVFDMVGLPADFMTRYPFELSGGMRQRVAIAMALVTEPDLIILDEPTSALDVLTQANLMNVLKRLKRDTDMTFVLITHDIATASDLADDVAVMYAGQIVEQTPARRFYTEPFHPYSKMLMNSVPSLKQDKDLEFIPGVPPSLLKPPSGCRFAERCPARFEKCVEEPPIFEVDGCRVKCWLYEEGGVKQ